MQCHVRYASSSSDAGTRSSERRVFNFFLGNSLLPDTCSILLGTICVELSRAMWYAKIVVVVNRMRNTRVLYCCTESWGRDGVERKTVATRGRRSTRVVAGGAVSCVRRAPKVGHLFTAADRALAYGADCRWWWRSRTVDGADVASFAGSVPVRRRWSAWAWNRGNLFGSVAWWFQQRWRRWEKRREIRRCRRATRIITFISYYHY